MTDSEDPKARRQIDYRAFWKDIIRPAAGELESFFWRVAWFTILIFVLFSFNPFR